MPLNFKWLWACHSMDNGSRSLDGRDLRVDIAVLASELHPSEAGDHHMSILAGGTFAGPLTAVHLNPNRANANN